MAEEVLATVAHGISGLAGAALRCFGGSAGVGQALKESRIVMVIVIER